MALETASPETRTARFTPEQREAWKKCKALLKNGTTYSRPLHIAMSELRAEQGRKHKGPIETLPKSEGKQIQYKAILIAEQIAARVAEWKQFLREPDKKKLYVIVRDDLSTSQQAVQASHAAAQFQKEHPTAPWVNGTMVLLVTDPTSKRYKWYTEPLRKPENYDPFEAFVTSHYRIDHATVWREPDQGNRITAMALLNHFRNEDTGKNLAIKLL